MSEKYFDHEAHEENLCNKRSYHAVPYANYILVSQQSPMTEHFLEQQLARELVHDCPSRFSKEKKVSKVISVKEERKKKRNDDTTTAQWFHTRPHLIAKAGSPRRKVGFALKKNIGQHIL